jgi:hypothetical protein
MNKYFSFLSIIILMLFFSCKKEKTHIFPTIELRTGGEFVSEGAILSEGKPIKFGIIVHKGDAKITNLVVKRVSGTNIRTPLDKGIYVDMIDMIFSDFKDSCKSEEWVISVMDQNRNSASASIHITKSDIISYGEIIYHPSITLGFQNNSEYPHFFDPINGKTYFTMPSVSEQTTTDILVYYFTDGSMPSPTFSSPFEEDAPTYYSELENWTTKNYTLYDFVSKVSTAEFEAANNDSLLIIKYVSGKRKYKYALENTIFPFKTGVGKLGIIRVISADIVDNGKITFAMKIQK